MTLGCKSNPAWWSPPPPKANSGASGGLLETWGDVCNRRTTSPRETTFNASDGRSFATRWWDSLWGVEVGGWGVRGWQCFCRSRVTLEHISWLKRSPKITAERCTHVCSTPVPIYSKCERLRRSRRSLARPDLISCRSFARKSSLILRLFFFFLLHHNQTSFPDTNDQLSLSPSMMAVDH